MPIVVLAEILNVYDLYYYHYMQPNILHYALLIFNIDL